MAVQQSNIAHLHFVFSFFIIIFYSTFNVLITFSHNSLIQVIKVLFFLCPIITVLSVLNHSYWVVGVVVGALVVSVLGHLVDPAVIRRYTNGMEFSMAALFIVILTDQIRAMKTGRR